MTGRRLGVVALVLAVAAIISGVAAVAGKGSPMIPVLFALGAGAVGTAARRSKNG